jgi:uncharacterized protein (TIGR03435 family)
VRYLVLGLIATVSVSAAPQSGPASQFEAVSIKPRSAEDATPLRIGFEVGRFVTVNAPLTFWMNQVYPNPSGRVEGQPLWLGTVGFDINAKADGTPAREQMLDMLRSMLRDRFKLAVHYETREEETFALVRDNTQRLEPQLKLTRIDCTAIRNAQSEGQAVPPLPPAANGQAACRTLSTSDGIVSGGMTIAELASTLRFAAARPVIDKTGLAGHYEVTLKFLDGGPERRDLNGDVEVFTALREQLGLRLIPEKSGVRVLVIDHIERPSEN